MRAERTVLISIQAVRSCVCHIYVYTYYDHVYTYILHAIHTNTINVCLSRFYSLTIGPIMMKFEKVIFYLRSNITGNKLD